MVLTLRSTTSETQPRDRRTVVARMGEETDARGSGSEEMPPCNRHSRQHSCQTVASARVDDAHKVRMQSGDHDVAVSVNTLRTAEEIPMMTRGVTHSRRRRSTVE